MDYAAWKLLHQSAVAISIAGFVLRGLASFAGAGWARGRVARTLPHAVDTALGRKRRSRGHRPAQPLQALDVGEAWLRRHTELIGL